MTDRQHRFRRWARRVAGVSLVVVGLVLVAARTGKLGDGSYRILYWMVAAPGRAAGMGELTAVFYFEASCRPYRYPRDVIALATMDVRRPGLERTVFTCGEAASGQGLRKWIEARRRN